jgi:hypothetical protein
MGIKSPPPNLPQILKSGFGGGVLITLSRQLQKKSTFLGEGDRVQGWEQVGYFYTFIQRVMTFFLINDV